MEIRTRPTFISASLLRCLVKASTCFCFTFFLPIISLIKHSTWHVCPHSGESTSLLRLSTVTCVRRIHASILCIASTSPPWIAGKTGTLSSSHQPSYLVHVVNAGKSSLKWLRSRNNSVTITLRRLSDEILLTAPSVSACFLVEDEPCYKAKLQHTLWTHSQL